MFDTQSQGKPKTYKGKRDEKKMKKKKKKKRRRAGDTFTWNAYVSSVFPYRQIAALLYRIAACLYE